VSVNLLEDAKDKYEDYFPGPNPVPIDKVADG